MLRLSLAIPFLVLAACGGNNSTPDTPDAPVIMLTDAPPPDAGPPDALVCNAPTKDCSGVCIDVTTDEQNCGDCGMPCQGGAYCQTTCMCPTSFIPSSYTPGSFDQFTTQQGITIGIAPLIGSEIDLLAVGYIPEMQTGGVVLNQDYDLSQQQILVPPLVAAGYNVNPNTQTADAAFYATAGTINFTKACDTEVAGTLTDVTFTGVSGGLFSPTIDPNGCTFTVPTMTFDIKSGAACP